MIRAACLLALFASACSFGFGSSYVGQWRAREVVDYQVCVEDQAGNCSARREVTSHQPARRYWGMSFLFPSLGISEDVLEGDGATGVRFELGAEYLRGRGHLAWGIRLSEVLDYAGPTNLDAGPLVTAMGHLGLSDRFSAYAGVGASPYSRLSIEVAGSEDRRLERSYLAGRALAGLQMVLAGNAETRFFLGLEGDTIVSRFDGADYRSSSFIFHLGLSI